jgi:hypothetical protein
MVRFASNLQFLFSFTALACHGLLTPDDASVYGPLAGQYVQFQMDGQQFLIKDVTAQSVSVPGTSPRLGQIHAEFLVGDTAAYIDIPIGFSGDTMAFAQQITLRLGREDTSALYFRNVGGGVRFKFVSINVLEGPFSAILSGLAGSPTEGLKKELKNGYVSVKYVQK